MSAPSTLDDLIAAAVGRAVAAALPTLAAAVADDVVRRLDQRPSQEILFSRDVARRYGKSVPALNRWLARKSGAHVAAVAITHGGRRAWRRVDLELLDARTVQP